MLTSEHDLMDNSKVKFSILLSPVYVTFSKTLRAFGVPVPSSSTPKRKILKTIIVELITSCLLERILELKA